MALVAPQVDVTALNELGHLLTDSGFRRSSSGDVQFAKDEQNEALAKTCQNNADASSGAATTRDRVRAVAVMDDACGGAAEDHRELGQLLMQTAGDAEEENSDDER